MIAKPLTLLLVAASMAGCARMRAPGFPPPARATVLVPTDFESTFSYVSGFLEARGLPILVEDASFGTVHTDWVYWEPGEVEITGMADCGLPEDSPPVRTRARFGFEVRRRANRAAVTILTQWQAERHPGLDESERGFTDCRSTGEWERMVEQTLTQRATIR